MGSLRVNHVSKSFQTPAEDLVILEDIELELQPGENAAIVGPSGCGKSTLLQILGVLDKPTSGSIEIAGKDPFQLSENEQARFRNDHIGFVFQDHHLLPQWNVLENTLLPSMAQGKPDSTVHQRAIQLLKRVGLENRLTHLPSQLSGGERERVAVARALLRKPLLVLADEPTGNLDEENAEKVSQLLLELPRAENAILIVVTHSTELASKMQKCFELKKGRLILRQ